DSARDEFDRDAVSLARQREDGAGFKRDDAAILRLQLQKRRRSDRLARFDIGNRKTIYRRITEENGQRLGGNRNRQKRCKRRRCEKPIEQIAFHGSGLLADQKSKLRETEATTRSYS